MHRKSSVSPTLRVSRASFRERLTPTVRRLTHKRSQPSSASEPTLYRLSRVARLRVEAQLGLRSVFMHHVDQLLKQHEVAWNRSYACPDEDAIDRFCLRLVLTTSFAVSPKSCK